MPGPPGPPPDNSSLADTSTRVVDDTSDVADVWSKDVMAAPVAPYRDAIISGETSMMLAYQDDAGYAAGQSDPLRATEEYLALIAGDEYATYKQPGESDEALRARMFAARATVSPAAIVAAANAVLAPYTSVSAKYFEHLDGLHARNGPFYDIVSATNASPIVVSTRWLLQSGFTTGSRVSVALVSGNTAANGSWVITVVMGPVVARSLDGSVPPTVTLSGTPVAALPIKFIVVVQGVLGVAQVEWTTDSIHYTTITTSSSPVTLGTTGLTVHFASGTYGRVTYTAAPSGFSLNGSTGNGEYAGSGSVSLASDSAPWSSHLYQASSFNGPNYPDRVYDALPNRRAKGARTFGNVYGRQFWLLVPEISGIDNTVAAMFGATAPSDGSGFFLGGHYPLVGQRVVTNASGFFTQLSATHELGVMQSNTGTTTITLHAAPSDGELNAVWDMGGEANSNPITVIAILGQSLVDPTTGQVIPPILGVASYAESRPGSLTIWQYHTSDSTWHVTALNATYVWAIQATSFDVYNAVIGAVDAIRGHGIRWWLWAEPSLN
jgi:hypothetical protein